MSGKKKKPFVFVTAPFLRRTVTCVLLALRTRASRSQNGRKTAPCEIAETTTRYCFAPARFARTFFQFQRLPAMLDANKEEIERKTGIAKVQRHTSFNLIPEKLLRVVFDGLINGTSVVVRYQNNRGVSLPSPLNSTGQESSMKDATFQASFWFAGVSLFGPLFDIANYDHAPFHFIPSIIIISVHS